MECFALGLALTQRRKATRKSPNRRCHRTGGNDENRRFQHWILLSSYTKKNLYHEAKTMNT